MPAQTNYDLAKVILDLLTIAKVAMPEDLYDVDPRVRAGQAMLASLRPGSSRPPSVTRAEQPEMPYLGEADPSDPSVRQILAALDAMPSDDWDVAAALDAYLAEPDSPATRPAAISLILRDWLVGHGYLEPLPPVEDGH